MEPTDITKDRVIKASDVKLFRVHTVAAILPPFVYFTYLNPVEVRSGNRRIGWASLICNWTPYPEVKADLVFDYASPERLSIETCTEKLYVRLEGVHTLGVEPYEHVGLYSERLQALQALDIFGLEISREPAYEGQPHLGEPLL